MKKKRHELILKLIEENDISTQLELLERLNANGFDTTQATISRDIKDLRLVKKPGVNGQSFYAVDKGGSNELMNKYKSIFSHSVISADFAGNTLVIRCYTGMAQAACAALDSMQWKSIVGTIAGDDTIFVLCRTPQSAEKMSVSINEIVGR